MGILGTYWNIFGEYIPFFLITWIAIILVFVFIYFSRIKGGKPRRVTLKRTFLEFIITSTVLAMIFVTIMPSHKISRYQYSIKLNLYPLLQGDVEFMINVLMYMVLASLLTLRLNGNLKVISLCIIFSFIIEVTQFLIPTGRMLSVTDFVLNAIGTVLGVFLITLLKRYLYRR